MNIRVARSFLYVGTLVSLGILFGLTVDTPRQVNALALDEHVVAGKRVWHHHRCDECHTILGSGSYYAPDLTKVYWRRGPDGIKRAVRTPEQVTTWRSMPRLPLTDRELDDLVAFLRWTSGIDSHDWPPGDIRLRASAHRTAHDDTHGPAALRESGCFDCHRMGEAGGALGPDLSHVGSRLDYETIDTLLRDPRAVNPLAVMPAPELSFPRREALARFLAGST